MRERIAQLINISLVLCLICLHFYLTIYRYEVINKENWVLDSGFFSGDSLEYSNLLFYLGLGLSLCLFFLMKGYWKSLPIIFGILFTLHFVFSLYIVNIGIVNIFLWSSLIINGITAWVVVQRG